MIWLVDNFAHIVGNSVSKGCGPMQWTTSEGSPWTKFSQSSYFAEIWSDSFSVAISGIFIEIWEMEIKHWIETLIIFGVFSANWFQSWFVHLVYIRAIPISPIPFIVHWNKKSLLTQANIFILPPLLLILQIQGWPFSAVNMTKLSDILSKF